MSTGRKCQRSRLRFCPLIMPILIHLSLSPPTLAAEPMELVKQTLDAVSAILHDSNRDGSNKEAEHREEVQKIILDHFDFEEMAEKSLGTYWEKLTLREREEFIGLFRDFFQRFFTRLVLESLPDKKILYGTEAVKGDLALVKTTLISKRSERVPVDYRLKGKGSLWKYVDVVINELSVVATCQVQFNNIIRISSYETLVQKMKTRQEEGSF